MPVNHYTVRLQISYYIHKFHVQYRFPGNDLIHVFREDHDQELHISNFTVQWDSFKYMILHCLLMFRY